METYTNGIPTADEFFKVMIRTLTSGPGLVGVVALLLLMLGVAVSKKARWVALAGVLYTGTFGFTYTAGVHRAFILPLEIIKQQSRSLAILLMLVVCFGAFFSNRGSRRKLLIGATLAVFVFELLYCGRLMFGGWFSKGAFGAVLFLLTFGSFAIALPLMIQDIKDVHSAIRCIAIAGALLCVGTAVQLVINRQGAIENGRLAFTPGTATHTAEAIAVTLPALLFLLLSKSEPKVLRILWLAVTGGLVIFLASTGTRNGLLMAVVSVAFLFRRSMGKMVVAAALIAVAAFLVWQVFGTEGTAETARRLIDTTDTRSAVWKATWRDFVANPAFGRSDAGTYTTENSYITVAARMGAFGLLPMAIAIGAVGLSLWRLSRLRRFLGEDALLVDYLIGGFMALACGAMFDAFLVGMLKLEIYSIYTYLAILTFVFDKMGQVMSGQPPAATDDWQETPARLESEPVPYDSYDMAGHYS